MFKDIQIYRSTFSHTHRRTTKGEGTGLPPPSPFFENWKRCPDFEKEGPDYVYLWVKFSVHSVVVRVSRRKNTKMFPCKISFSCVIDEVFIEVL